MKLIYVYIKNVANNILSDKGFNFSREYNIELKNSRIEISDYNNYLNYGKTVYNISAIVGENGSGKSTVIQALRDYDINNNEDVVFLFESEGDFYSDKIDLNVVYNGKIIEIQQIKEKIKIFYDSSNLLTNIIFKDKTNNGRRNLMDPEMNC